MFAGIETSPPTSFITVSGLGWAGLGCAMLNCAVVVWQVVASTCAGSGDPSIVGFREFRMVVIDEATQSIEPSTLIPLVCSAL